MGRGDLVPRIITDFDVRIRLHRDKSFGRVWPVNLSETGVCIRLRLPVEEKQYVDLKITLGNEGDVMILCGRIAWVREDTVEQVFYCGIGFTSLSKKQLEKIRNYVEAGSEALMDFFSGFPLFDQFSHEDCRGLLRIVTLRRLQKKEFLYSEGEIDMDLQGIFIVQSGLLSIFKGKKAKPHRRIAVVSPGEIFGEFTLLYETPHTATVMAVNDTTLIQINKMGLQLLKEENPALACKIMELVARSLADSLKHATKKLFCPVRA
jgi:CRP/FNR family cyclic AMP-dependent transcriptional regulator